MAWTLVAGKAVALERTDRTEGEALDAGLPLPKEAMGPTPKSQMRTHACGGAVSPDTRTPTDTGRSEYCHSATGLFRGVKLPISDHDIEICE
eukprot:4130526-Prymnesium_polylepis.1